MTYLRKNSFFMWFGRLWGWYRKRRRWEYVGLVRVKTVWIKPGQRTEESNNYSVGFYVLYENGTGKRKAIFNGGEAAKESVSGALATARVHAWVNGGPLPILTHDMDEYPQIPMRAKP